METAELWRAHRAGQPPAVLQIRSRDGLRSPVFLLNTALRANEVDVRTSKKHRRHDAARPDSIPVAVAPPYTSADERFFRRVIGSVGRAIVVIHRDGRLVLINEAAGRLFSLSPHLSHVGRPFAEVFRECPELIGILSGAFGLATALPNRAELRVNEGNRIVGYTLSQVTDDAGLAMAAVLSCTDLTLIRQRQEQQRLLEQLVSLGEMAVNIANELTDPLAAIAVLAGLVGRQECSSLDEQAIVAAILKETQTATAIMRRMLDTVRPPLQPGSPEAYRAAPPVAPHLTVDGSVDHAVES